MKAFFAYLIAAIVKAFFQVGQEMKRENRIAKDMPDCNKKRLNKLRNKYRKRMRGE